MPQRGLSNHMTVIGLVNGMIGGIILIMPILALNTGYLLIAPVTLISALFSYFSSLLCLRHLRNYKDLDESILKHFGNNRKYKIFYDVIIVISFFALLILYFGLMSDMWYGLTEETKIIPIINAFVLFPIVYVMKKFHFGASLLAYGILSIIGYCIFLVWMWAVAPEGPNKLQPADSQFVELGAALAQGFAIQTFFIPILKQNPNRQLYKKLLFLTYSVGFLVYTFIGYSGAFSILNMEYKGPSDRQAQQIGDYFGNKQWQLIVVQIIYLVHLYSAYPQFLLISKKRFFSIFQWPQTDDVTFKEIVYVAVIIFVCLAIQLTSISPEIIVQLNGSIISFFFIYIIPISLHIKCVYFTNNDERHINFQDEEERQKQIELRGVKMNDENNNNQETDKQKDANVIEEEKTQEKQSSLVANQDDSILCDTNFRSRTHEICEIILMVLMVAAGLFTMGFTIYKLISKSVGENSNDET